MSTPSLDKSYSRPLILQVFWTCARSALLSVVSSARGGAGANKAEYARSMILNNHKS